MTTTQNKVEYTVDAKGKRLGRLASEIAVLLMGKNLPSFERNQVPKVQVTVENASLMDVDAKKRTTKEYKHHTGYPGGLRVRSMDKVIADKGYAEVLTIAVQGMLPKNKLQSRMMQNITINE